MNPKTLWRPQGQGILLHPNPELSNRQILTEVVELKDFGRIFEVYHYGNEPEQTQRLIVAAPQLLFGCQKIVAHFNGMKRGALSPSLTAAVDFCNQAIEQAT